jgi:regulator of cell morphogenesis and NO signaling
MDENSCKLPEPWDGMPLARLMDHIVQTHHVFCRREVTRLGSLLKEVLDKHGKNHPELRRIQALFFKMSKDLSMHLLKEEQTLFPYIARFEEAVANTSQVSWPLFGTVENPIRVMVFEHDQTDDELKEIGSLSNGYAPPIGVCVSFAALYEGLRVFEEDLQKHIHFENNLLFPRAIAMEEEACARRKQAGG